MDNESKKIDYSNKYVYFYDDSLYQYFSIFFLCVLFFTGQWLIDPSAYLSIYTSWWVIGIPASIKGINMKEIESVKSLIEFPTFWNKKVNILFVPYGFLIGILTGSILYIGIPLLCSGFGIQELEHIIAVGGITGASLGYIEGGKKYITKIEIKGNFNIVSGIIGLIVGSVIGSLICYSLFSLYLNVGSGSAAIMAAFGGITGAIFGYLEAIRISARKIGWEKGVRTMEGLIGLAVGATVGSLLAYGIFGIYSIYVPETATENITIFGVLFAVFGYVALVEKARKRGWDNFQCFLLGSLGFTISTIISTYLVYLSYILEI